MANYNRHMYACVVDAEFTSKLEGVAHELHIQVVAVTHRESLLSHSEISDALCILVEFSGFDPEAAAFIDACRVRVPGIPVIAILKQSSPTDAVRFSRAGVFECLDTLSASDDIFNALQLARAQSARTRAENSALLAESWRRQIVGESAPIEHVIKIIRLVAARRCTVLISGETGTGKEMAARAIHMASDRARKPMVSVNCSAIPENLIEAELFGHVKGAFTGAINARIGRFEQANGGTLFLDEIGDLPFDLQAKLLRVLQEREIQRLGSSETIKVDVRVIAATNANLQARVQEGRFREDLYYRLNVVPVHMPALRNRLSDIPLLVSHFVRKVCTAEAMNGKSVSPEATDNLCSYSWPGNVRELENVVEHAVIMSADRDCLYPSDFALPSASRHENSTVISVPASNLPDEGFDFTLALRQFERAILQQALTRAQGNKTLAADMLRLPRTTLIHKLRVLEQAVA